MFTLTDARTAVHAVILCTFELYSRSKEELLCSLYFSQLWRLIDTMTLIQKNSMDVKDWLVESGLVNEVRAAEKNKVHRVYSSGPTEGPPANTEASGRAAWPEINK